MRLLTYRLRFACIYILTSSENITFFQSGTLNFAYALHQDTLFFMFQLDKMGFLTETLPKRPALRKYRSTVLVEKIDGLYLLLM